MSAKILPKHTYRKQCSHDYFINSFVFFLITAGVIVVVSREVSGSCA